MTHHQTKTKAAQQAVQQWLHKTQRQEQTTAYLSQSKSMHGPLRIAAARLPQAQQYPLQLTDVDARYRRQDACKHTPQSCSGRLVSFASLSAISGTFNSLSKVLFTFPSQYLFAIGLGSIFSFRCYLPPTLRSTSKEHDSSEAHRTSMVAAMYGILTLSDAVFQRTYAAPHPG